MIKIKRGTIINLRVDTKNCFSIYDVIEKLRNQLIAEYDIIEPDLTDETLIPFIIEVLKVNHPDGCFKLNPANTLSMSTISTEQLIKKLQNLQKKLEIILKEPSKVEQNDKRRRTSNRTSNVSK